jgi:protein-S-isoprenylcysteine O-methyltransferase Ste14
MLGNAVSFVLLLGLGAFAYEKRIVAEEQLLLDTLGDEYREYVRTTKRLLSFAW